MYEFYNGYMPRHYNQKLEQIPACLFGMGYEILYSDLRTNHNTAKTKQHGVFSILFKDADKYYLMTGTYNYVSVLEGQYSIFKYEHAEQNQATRDMKRWSGWDNPMHDCRAEAWYKAFKYTKVFESIEDLKDFGQQNMKHWEDAIMMRLFIQNMGGQYG